MPIRFRIHRDNRIQPQGLAGCFLTLLGVGALAVLAVSLLLPFLGIVLGIALGAVVLGMAALAYYRVRGWFRELRAGGRREPNYQAQVLDLEDDEQDEGEGPPGPQSPAPQERLTVQVRRRPPVP